MVERTSPPASGDFAGASAQKLRRNAVSVGTCGTSGVVPKTMPSWLPGIANIGRS
jgi:hypothetical protein